MLNQAINVLIHASNMVIRAINKLKHASNMIDCLNVTFNCVLQWHFKHCFKNESLLFD